MITDFDLWYGEIKGSMISSDFDKHWLALFVIPRFIDIITVIEYLLDMLVIFLVHQAQYL